MKTVQFSVEFNVRDIMRDPEMRKALQEREQTYQKNIAWLDEDLNEKLEQRKRDLLQEIQTSSTVTETQPQRTPKIWHCGHGIGNMTARGSRSPTAEKRRLKITRIHHEKGLQGNYCVIAHWAQQLQKKGNNTRRQYEKFCEEAQEGDIIFTHCGSKGGLTHWGIYTGEIIDSKWDDPENGNTGVDSQIMVYEWNPLPEVAKGLGKNLTLYEVTPTNKDGTPFKNYQNYRIQS